MMKTQTSLFQASPQQLQRHRLFGRITKPGVFSNRVSKAGTNLLVRLLERFAALRLSGTNVCSEAGSLRISARIDRLACGVLLATAETHRIFKQHALAVSIDLADEMELNR